MIIVDYGKLSEGERYALEKTTRPTKDYCAVLRIDNIPSPHSISFRAFKPDVPFNIQEIILKRFEEKECIANQNKHKPTKRSKS